VALKAYQLIARASISLVEALKQALVNAKWRRRRHQNIGILGSAQLGRNIADISAVDVDIKALTPCVCCCAPAPCRIWCNEEKLRRHWCAATFTARTRGGGRKTWAKLFCAVAYRAQRARSSRGAARCALRSRCCRAAPCLTPLHRSTLLLLHLSLRARIFARRMPGCAAARHMLLLVAARCSFALHSRAHVYRIAVGADVSLSTIHVLRPLSMGCSGWKSWLSDGIAFGWRLAGLAVSLLVCLLFCASVIGTPFHSMNGVVYLQYIETSGLFRT